MPLPPTATSTKGDVHTLTISDPLDLFFGCLPVGVGAGLGPGTSTAG